MSPRATSPHSPPSAPTLATTAGGKKRWLRQALSDKKEEAAASVETSPKRRRISDRHTDETEQEGKDALPAVQPPEEVDHHQPEPTLSTQEPVCIVFVLLIFVIFV